MFQIGVCILNYLGHLASADTVEKAPFTLNTLRAILNKCCIEEANTKACPPSTVMIVIGILFNTVKITIEVTGDQISSKNLVEQGNCMLQRGAVSFRQSACVRPGKIFISKC